MQCVSGVISNSLTVTLYKSVKEMNRDFKIGDYGRLGRLDRCHVTQNTRDLLPSSFWDGMFSPGFSCGLDTRWLVFTLIYISVK